MDEAKMLVLMRADEKQVLAEEAGEVGRLLLLGHQAAEHLAQRHGHAATGLENVGILELDDEDAPRAVGQGELADAAFDDFLVEVRGTQFFFGPVVGDLFDRLDGRIDRPVQQVDQHFLNE